MIGILSGIETYGKGKFEVLFSEGYKIYENDTRLRLKKSASFTTTSVEFINSNKITFEQL